MPLHIDYESEDFAASAPVKNGQKSLSTSWDDLLWAAVTVGRPNRHYVFRHGESSLYEALFRWSLVRMALEQSGPRGSTLRRTDAARTLDPSEKGAINYFLGLSVCKLFAAALLNTPWLLHLDVFRPMLNPVLTGRSRPDLVGQMTDGSWLALECKGRITQPNESVKKKAKLQAQRLIRINGARPAFHVGSIAYFKNDTLKFYWRDPEPPEGARNPIDVPYDPSVWRHYYAPVLQLIQSDQESFDRMKQEPTLMRVDAADIEIGIHPQVLAVLIEARWNEARGLVESLKTDVPGIRYHPDGIAVIAGQSWLRPFESSDLIGV
jgi:hypothetical protein